MGSMDFYNSFKVTHGTDEDTIGLFIEAENAKMRAIPPYLGKRIRLSKFSTYNGCYIYDGCYDRGVHNHVE